MNNYVSILILAFSSFWVFPKGIVIPNNNNSKMTIIPFENIVGENKNIFVVHSRHSLWNDLLQKHVSSKGKVNYKGFKADAENFEAYLKFLSVNEPQDSWAKAEKFTYWINAYNAFTVKLIIDNYPVKSIKDIDKPWDKKFIPIGGKLLSLNHIEHEILRKMDEPRIHFAIVCASVSCPKLQNTAFEASRLEEQLTNVTTAFLADQTRNKISENSFEISKIFKWFAKDFKQNGSLIDFLNLYSEITISQKASKRFMDYDWDLNE